MSQTGSLGCRFPSRIAAANEASGEEGSTGEDCSRGSARPLTSHHRARWEHGRVTISDIVRLTGTSRNPLKQALPPDVAKRHLALYGSDAAHGTCWHEAKTYYRHTESVTVATFPRFERSQ